jgi:hypothetical protein
MRETPPKRSGTRRVCGSKNPADMGTIRRKDLTMSQESSETSRSGVPLCNSMRNGSSGSWMAKAAFM